MGRTYAGWSGIFWHGTQDWPVDEATALFGQGMTFVHEAWDEAGVAR